MSTYTIVDPDGVNIGLDNVIYQSQYLKNSDQTSEVPISKSIKSYYFSDISTLSYFEIVDCIIFWDYLLSDVYMVSGSF